MQSAYLSYLMNKNHIPSAVIESACGLSAASVSRIKSGKLEVPMDEFARIVAAAGGDIAAYNAFCVSLNKSPDVITPENKEEAAITLSVIQKFYTEQIAEIEARFVAEIDRLTTMFEKELQVIERVHEREIERLEAFYTRNR